MLGQHCPPQQTSAPLQSFLQAPQFSSSVSVFVSHPVRCRLSQLRQPGSHCAILHAPDTQDASACARLHCLEHIPDWSAALLVLLTGLAVFAIVIALHQSTTHRRSQPAARAPFAP